MNKRKILILIVLLVVIVAVIVAFGYRIQSNDRQMMKEAIISYTKAHEFDKALALSNQYVRSYPNDLEGWVNRGVVYYDLGDCAEALSDFYHASVNGNEKANVLITDISNSESCKANR